MKIIFNLINTGAGNNGGSHTLIQSANTLHDLGEEVVIIDSGPCRYTWDKVKVPYLKVTNPNEVKGDVVIGTGMNSIKSTNSLNIQKKYIWLRGFETWVTPEANLIKILKDSQAKKLVNSICLKNKFEKYGIHSDIIRPGHTFEDFIPAHIDNKDITVIGGLYNQGAKRAKKRTEWIFNCYDILKKKYNINLWMFGSDGTPNREVTAYVKNPDIKMKNRIYNNIDIWLSPSELEGLHIAPAEAMLTECAVVGNKSELNGTDDYLIDDITGFVSKNTFEAFLNNVTTLILNKTLRKRLGKAGREKILSLGDRKDNMQKLIKLLKEDNNE